MEYAIWHRSCPFDVGRTCGRAFASTEGSADAMRANAVRHSADSEANGSLMRIAPLALWVAGFEASVKTSVETVETTVMSFARQEARLSHPHPVCQDVNALFCLALLSLVREDPEGVEGTDSAARARRAISRVDAALARSGDVGPEVRRWYAESAAATSDAFDCRENVGHVRHAFTLAFHFLRRCASFSDGIRETLLRGGDTDTNAAIVGAMLGALHGLEGIPEAQRATVLAVDPSTLGKVGTTGRRRPSIYSAAKAMKLLSC
jgi:ADP-ribosylglycohydrolase